MQPSQRFLFAIIFSALISQPSAAQDVKLHDFITETAYIYDSELVTDGEHLYGVRYDGHVDGKGAIFRTDMDGGSFEVMHSFDNPLEGYNPVGTLALSGSTLYGMTVFGGADDMGVIFKIETDGTGFHKILDFDFSNGALPFASLIVRESVLYGITQQGGKGYGLVFRANTDGTGYQKLLAFDGANGQSPVGALAISGDTLFGVTLRGGASDQGVIYRIQTNGEGHEVIFNFNDETGYNPFNGLIVSGTTLYGTTGQGGSSSAFGSVFSINTDGSEFLQFPGLSNSNPNGKLTLIDNKLYGMTSSGGWGGGVIYAVDIAAKSFTTLHEFNIVDGENPWGSLLYSGNKLYGYVPRGIHGYDVIFSLDPDGENFNLLKDFEATNTGFDPAGGLTFTTGRAYGVTTHGGTHNSGVIYSIKHDGTDYQVVHNFQRETGSQPEVSLLMSDNALYGVTLFGGTGQSGVLFRVDTTGENYEVLHNFNTAEGSFPSGSLVDDGEGSLYGITGGGGLDNKGTMFRLDKETGEYVTLFDFSSTDAQNPRGTMVLADTLLYGLALGGVGDGVLFSLKTDGTAFKKIVDRDSETAGRYGNSLVLKDSVLYVTMKQGGPADVGVLFSVRTDGTKFKKLHDFSYGSGAVPEGLIAVRENLIYGMTMLGGPDDSGVTYSITTDGMAYNPLFTFDDTPGSSSGRVAATGHPASALGSISILSDVLYATVTTQNDRATKGTIRRYNLVQGDDTITGITRGEGVAVQLFPNPATSYITVQGAERKPIILRDASGRRVALAMQDDTSLDIRGMSPGVYYLSVGEKIFRFIKY